MLGALHMMGNNKSPTLMVSPNNIMCLFLQPNPFIFIASFKHVFSRSSQRQAVIVLIEKKNKDKRFLKNSRPISPINVDAKIESKAVALRIKKVIGNLVHCDQTAYVCKRNIGESVRLINDILGYTDQNDIEAIYSLQTLRKLLIRLNTLSSFSPLEHLDLVPILFCDSKRFSKI